MVVDEMRNAIRDRLLAAIPEIKDVYEPHAADKDSVKPYAVVLQGEESDQSPWVGFRRIVEVWPYVSRTTFETIDALDKKIITALDKQLLTTETGEVFSCTYLGSAGQDTVDDEWDAITRGMQFAVMALQPVGQLPAIISEPWLDALKSWTEGVMGKGWVVYTGLWPLGYKRPCILWRVTSIDSKQVMFGSYKLNKKFTAHVIGIDEAQEYEGILKLLNALAAAIKIPYDPSDRQYMTVTEPRANNEADSVTEGQITVNFSRRTARPVEESVVMRSVSFKSTMN
jgi:hypothetical protein